MSGLEIILTTTRGLDRDKDGIGDIPYINKAYADKLWLYNSGIKFFYGSPVMSLSNFFGQNFYTFFRTRSAHKR